MTEAGEPTHAAPPPGDSARLIAHDAACRVCRYNLRGQPPAGVCPECGAPVALALSGDLLRYSDQRWLRRVVCGAWLVCGGLLGVSALLFCAVASPPSRIPMGLRRTFVSAAEIGAAVVIAGALLLLRAEPPAVHNRRPPVSRRIALLAVLALVAAWSAEIYIRNTGARRLLHAAAATALSAGLFALLAASFYFAALAQRTTAPHLASRFQALGIALSICLLLYFPPAVSAPFISTPPREVWHELFLILSYTSVPASAMFAFILAAYFSKLIGLLDDELQHARRLARGGEEDHGSNA